MKTQALITMLLTNLVVAGFTAYFFWRVLTIAPPDSVDEDEASFPRGG